MLANTGTVSFILYGVFIIITIVAMVFAFKQIKSGTIETDKLDKMIELFKYAIVSTAIATVTLVVSDLFKEREQDVKELEYFDKYVADVKKVDGIQERLQLSKYLSIVAPSGELKKSWTNYYNTVKIEYQDYTANIKIKQKLDTIKNPTEEQIVKSFNAENKIKMYESPLSISEDVSSLELKANKLSANDFEKLGFENLLDKNYEKAKANFNNSYEIFPKLHNVDEINRLLNKIQPTNNDSWNQVYSIILKNYSWGMPNDIKKELIKSTSGTNN